MQKLDLHHARHYSVRSKLIRFIEKNWNVDEDVEIVTGNSNEMKSMVKEVLEEYRLEYRIGDMQGINTGFIRVEM